MRQHCFKVTHSDLCQEHVNHFFTRVIKYSSIEVDNYVLRTFDGSNSAVYIIAFLYRRLPTRTYIFFSNVWGLATIKKANIKMRTVLLKLVGVNLYSLSFFLFYFDVCFTYAYFKINKGKSCVHVLNVVIL